MAVEAELVRLLLVFAQKAIDNGRTAMISVKFGGDYAFEFDNRGKVEFGASRKKLSPSTIKRNLKRKLEFENKVVNLKTDILTETKDDIATQTDLDITTTGVHIDTQTEHESVDLFDKETNTEDIHINTLEEAIGIDENGIIKPRTNEVLVEMAHGHTVNTWEDIEHLIGDKLKMKLLGKPWISNTGKHYMTIGFRTARQDYENWKIQTFNWQESGIRAVTSSRMYR